MVDNLRGEFDPHRHLRREASDFIMRKYIDAPKFYARVSDADRTRKKAEN
jgi:hypothetical protein